MEKYGLLIEPIVIGKDWVFGSDLAAQAEVLQPNGQWDEYLPSEEYQNLNGIEPSACVSFGTHNAIEMLIRRQFGETRNYSDRFLAKISGTTRAGNGPHYVAEVLRNKGTVPEQEWTFDSSINTFEKFYAEIPSRLMGLANAFKAELEFTHDYVPTNHQSLMNALKYSPLGFSVYAWMQDGDGLYFKPAGATDNHWCVCYGYEQGVYWKIFDSYDNSLKRVRWDALPLVAKRYALKRQVVNESAWTRFRKLLAAIFAEPTPPAAPQSKLYAAALSCIGMDGSPNDLAPDELGCAETVNEIHKKAYGVWIAPKNPLSTYWLYAALKSSPNFKKVSQPEPGDIVISPTGYGHRLLPNGEQAIRNGHTGIVALNDTILSNNSYTGKFEANYTIESWAERYVKKGGYPMYYYRRI